MSGVEVIATPGETTMHRGRKPLPRGAGYLPDWWLQEVPHSVLEEEKEHDRRIASIVIEQHHLAAREIQRERQRQAAEAAAVTGELPATNKTVLVVPSDAEILINNSLSSEEILADLKTHGDRLASIGSANNASSIASLQYEVTPAGGVGIAASAAVVGAGAVVYTATRPNDEPEKEEEEEEEEEQKVREEESGDQLLPAAAILTAEEHEHDQEYELSREASNSNVEAVYLEKSHDLAMARNLQIDVHDHDEEHDEEHDHEEHVENENEDEEDEDVVGALGALGAAESDVGHAISQETSDHPDASLGPGSPSFEATWAAAPSNSEQEFDEFVAQNHQHHLSTTFALHEEEEGRDEFEEDDPFADPGIGFDDTEDPSTPENIGAIGTVGALGMAAGITAAASSSSNKDQDSAASPRTQQDDFTESGVPRHNQDLAAVTTEMGMPPHHHESPTSFFDEAQPRQEQALPLQQEFAVPSISDDDTSPMVEDANTGKRHFRSASGAAGIVLLPPEEAPELENVGPENLRHVEFEPRSSAVMRQSDAPTIGPHLLRKTGTHKLPKDYISPIGTGGSFDYSGGDPTGSGGTAVGEGISLTHSPGATGSSPSNAAGQSPKINNANSFSPTKVQPTRQYKTAFTGVSSFDFAMQRRAEEKERREKERLARESLSRHHAWSVEADRAAKSKQKQDEERQKKVEARKSLRSHRDTTQQ